MCQTRTLAKSCNFYVLDVSTVEYVCAMTHSCKSAFFFGDNHESSDSGKDPDWF